MPLHNKKDHMDCVYYATDEKARCFDNIVCPIVRIFRI